MNQRGDLARLFRQPLWQAVLFAVPFVYLELVLRAFSGAALFPSLYAPVLFGLAAGLLVAGLSGALPARACRVVRTVVLYLTGFVFAVECLVRGSFQLYMTPANILAGTGGVVKDFTGLLLRAILHGLPQIALFLLPAVLYTVFGRRLQGRCGWGWVAGIVAAALVLGGGELLVASHGPDADKYGPQYEFNTAVHTFGLLQGMFLEGRNALVGTPAETFVFEEEPADDPEESSDAEAPDAETPDEEAPDAETPDEETPGAETPGEETPPVLEVSYGENAVALDFAALAQTETEAAYAELDRYVASQKPSKQNKYTGLFAGKNLILICAEAFSDVVIDPELTPTLYRLSHNGIYFSEYYQPAWGGSTSTGEYSMLMGIAPVEGVQSMYRTKDCNNYFTMGNQLQRLGYYSAAYHSGSYSFYHRDLTHENLGYATYLGMGNGIEDLVGNDVSDTTLFDKTLDACLDKQPFSLYYMTLSGHCIYSTGTPYANKYLDRVREVLGDERYQTKTLCYFAYQMELENALRVLVEKLERAGIADDTVICLTADHYPYGLENSAAYGNSADYLSDLYGYTAVYPWERDHNTWILWSGCLEHEQKAFACEIAEPTYSLDILPTLSNLFGVEYDSRLLMGRDVFSDEEAVVVWNDYSWVTKRGKYYAATDTFYPNEGYTEQAAYTARIKNLVRNRMSLSRQVIQYDYYGHLFGPDEVTGQAGSAADTDPEADAGP